MIYFKISLSRITTNPSDIIFIANTNPYDYTIFKLGLLFTLFSLP